MKDATDALLGLIASNAVTEPTRRALHTRLATPPVLEPRAMSAEAFGTLRAVCDRLIPQDGESRVDLAGAVDTRLAEGHGDGWRYDTLPPDTEAWGRGLAALDGDARAMAGVEFVALQPALQNAVLTAVQAGAARDEGWQGLDAARWFEEVLAAVSEAWMSHPLTQAYIGYVGFADAAGWHAVGLGGHDLQDAALG